ncbi:MAG TPA: lamin tail domain-containing protein [Candidatus Portnoybacteria bacterium]|jgi:hypothetical protein|nr:lamin tail domain-containing protein [Candidatus Portnoybacteria bacterium]MDD5752155.1 lamin tail domain-containing protein [Candidatus Portnoybacteria bacterium]HOZ16449.1 lamin tail domain-containing protein [Candidatus Portnoybacteria bacterium]HPH52119.1 lamin tail domain-containing protein [Candidatus Portnoybacteria bacterium]HPJ80268.1 lamin tail domain-containing protein [Candidatus Portnoybacteria bacterium]
MQKIFLGIIIIVVLFLSPKIVFGSVVINEVFYNPGETDTGLEYIVLYNNGSEPYSLNNYCLYAAGKHYIINSLTINPNNSTIIHWNADGTNTSTDIYTGKSLKNMSNTSGVVSLSSSDQHTSSTIKDYIRYGTTVKTWENDAVSAGIWTTGSFIPNVQEGKAIKLIINGVDNNLPSDWIETTPSVVQTEESSSTSTTTEETETPEIPESTTNNSPPTANAGDNIIGFIDQEILFDGSLSSDPDNNELAYSWNTGDGNSLDKISLTHKYAYPGTYLATLTVFDGRYYSTDTITVQIQQAQIIINEFMPNPEGKDEEEEWVEIYNGADSISDISNWQLDDMASGSKAFVFPKNTFIAPKSYLVFSRQTTKIALNNNIDSVRLLMPDGTVFQEINYEKPPQGKSSARTEEGFVWSEPTPGMANISSIIGINPSTGSRQAKQTVSQMNVVAPQTTKNSTKTYSIDLPKNDIEGGYIQLSNNSQTDTNRITIQRENKGNNKGDNEMALIRQNTQNPLNLTLLIICIVFGASFMGLLLVKFRKKGLPT